MLSKLMANRALMSSIRSSNVPNVKCLFAATSNDKHNMSTAHFQTNNNNNPYMDSYQSYFTHNPVEGYIRNSPYDVVTTPNLAIDQYIWQNVTKWPNHIATVSEQSFFFSFSLNNSRT